MMNDENKNSVNVTDFGQSRFDVIGKESSSPVSRVTTTREHGGPFFGNTNDDTEPKKSKATIGQFVDVVKHRVGENMKGEDTLGQKIDNFSGMYAADTSQAVKDSFQHATDRKEPVHHHSLGDTLKEAFGFKPEPHTDHIVSRPDNVDETVVLDPVYDKSQDPIGADIVPNTRFDASHALKPDLHKDHLLSTSHHVDETIVQDPVYDKSQDPVGADIVPNTRADVRAITK
jgi:hypothetical protein